MDLKKGTKGPEVAAWQTWLKSRNLDIKIDGDFGTETDRLTRIWQKLANVPVTGVVDEITLAAAKSLGFASVIVDKPIQIPSESHQNVFDGSRIDRINAAQLARVAPALQNRGQKFIDAARADGVIVQIVQGLRTFAEQNALYKIGRRGIKGEKKVTNAIGGQSLHNYGLALDFAPVIDGEPNWDDENFVSFPKWAAQAGLESGAAWRKFVDTPHVQDDEGMTLAEVQKLYKAGGLAAVWARVK
jgi:peptidoglycan hydrolase-like protein with peptidoglycan-binding domain